MSTITTKRQARRFLADPAAGMERDITSDEMNVIVNAIGNEDKPDFLISFGKKVLTSKEPIRLYGAFLVAKHHIIDEIAGNSPRSKKEVITDTMSILIAFRPLIENATQNEADEAAALYRGVGACALNSVHTNMEDHLRSSFAYIRGEGLEPEEC